MPRLRDIGIETTYTAPQGLPPNQGFDPSQHQVDVAIATQMAPSSPGHATLKLAIQNRGQAAATDVVVEVVQAQTTNLTAVVGNTSQGSFAPSGFVSYPGPHTYEVDLGTLAPDAVANVTIFYAFSGSGPMGTLTASVASDGIDVHLGDKQASMF